MRIGLKTVKIGDEVEVTYEGHEDIRVGVIKELKADAILVKQAFFLRVAKMEKYAPDTGYRLFKISKITHIKVR